MAYETGTSSGIDDTLDKIRIFLSGLGWTINRWAARSDTFGQELCLFHADAGYFNLISRNDNFNYSTLIAPSVFINVSTAFDSGIATMSQVGNSGSPCCSAYNMDAPFVSYHLFATTEYCHVVIEFLNGVFVNIGFGKAIKTWDYDGGEYIFTTRWTSTTSRNLPDSSANFYPFDINNQSQGSPPFTGYTGLLRADLTGVSPRYFTNASMGNHSTSSDVLFSSSPRSANKSPYGSHWHNASPNSFNGISVAMPVQLVGQLSPSIDHKLLATIKDMRFINITNITDGQSIFYGSDEWVNFPICRKSIVGVPTNEYSSGVYGVCYRKV